jgi:hypothetical protein
LADVTEAANRWHEHGVNVYFTKERGGNGDSRWNANLRRLAELALVAGTDVPFDIVLERRPPEPVEERSTS